MSNADETAGAAQVASLIDSARKLLEKSDAAGAIHALQQAIALPGCSAEAHLEAGPLFVEAGSKPDAVACFLEAGTHYLYDAGDMPKARTAFAQAHTLEPANLDVVFQMGQADVVEGRTQDALAKFIDVLRKSNLKHVPALFEAGCIYQANGQYDQAILAFKKVLDRDKNHVQAIVHMGQLHQTKGMVPESLGYFLQAADIARESKQFGTAQQLLHMVLALDGGNQKARIMLDDLEERHRESLEAAQAADVAPSSKVVEQRSSGAQDAAPGAVDPSFVAAKAGVPADVARSLEEAKRTLAELQAERDAVQREVEDLSGSRLDIEYALARAKDEAEAAVAARDMAAAARGDAERGLADISKAFERNRALADEAARRKNELDAELAAATAKLQSAKKAEAAIQASAEKRREQLEIDLAELVSKRIEAEAQARVAQDAAAAAAAERAKLQSETNTLRDENAAELKAIAARQAEARSLADAAVGKRRAEIEADAKALHDQTAARLQALAARVAQSQAEVDAAAATRDQTAAQLEALTLRVAQTQAEVDAAAATRDQVRADAAAAEATLASLRERVKKATVGAADADKLVVASGELKKLEAAVTAAGAKLAETKVSLGSVEARKREIEEAYANSKSLAAAAESKRAEAAQAAEQAEALRAKREADAEALGTRIAALEHALKDADARAKLIAGENAALEDVTAKVSAQRKVVLGLEDQKNSLESQSKDAEQGLKRLVEEVAAAQASLEQAQAQAQAANASAGGITQRTYGESYADTPAAAVSPETCAESLRTIESLAADGEIPFEIAAELAGLIHEGRAVEALRVSRARANLEADPASYLLVVGDLSRDLGDAAGAREAYRTLGAADPSKGATAHQRLGQLFLMFADQSTAAALQRDDAHFATGQEPAKALEAYADLVARFPNDPLFRHELGEIHERLGNLTAAGLAYTQAMVQYLGSDDAAKAVELVPKLLSVRPSSGDALELASRALERAGRAPEAQARLDEALQAYRHAKAASDVERVCRRLAEMADDPVPYRRELSALLKDVGDSAGAAEQLIEAAERLLKWSNAPDALSLIKEAAVLAGDNEPLLERIGVLKRSATESQSSVDQAARAAMFLSKKQYDKAADAYRAAVDKNPYNADACYQLACLLTDNFPDYATAEQLLENAAELRPGHTATRYRLALVKAARGDVEQAVELLVALARFDEHNADFIDQFVERLEKDADSGKTAAKYRLGIAYRELGRVEEALVILQSIQRDQDFMVLCLNAIGLCLRRQGLDTAAAKRFQKAIEMPGYPENQYNEALYNLGDLYLAKLDPESLALSLSSFEELYARDCTFRDVADRIRSVKSKLGAAEGPKVKRLPNRSDAVNER